MAGGDQGPPRTDARLCPQEVFRMKRLGKTLSSAFAVLVLVLVVGITFTIGWHPFIGPKVRPLTARTFERTPQRLERGRYIAIARSGCI